MHAYCALQFVIKEQPDILEEHTGRQSVLSFCYADKDAP